MSSYYLLQKNQQIETHAIAQTCERAANAKMHIIKQLLTNFKDQVHLFKMKGGSIDTRNVISTQLNQLTIELMDIKGIAKELSQIQLGEHTQQQDIKIRNNCQENIQRFIAKCHIELQDDIDCYNIFNQLRTEENKQYIQNISQEKRQQIQDMVDCEEKEYQARKKELDSIGEIVKQVHEIMVDMNMKTQQQSEGLKMMNKNTKRVRFNLENTNTQLQESQRQQGTTRAFFVCIWVCFFIVVIVLMFSSNKQSKMLRRELGFRVMQ